MRISAPSVSARSAILLATCLLACSLGGCADAPPPTCGEGTAPVTVTGLTGVLDESTPIVEVIHRVPETCEVLQRTWMFWDDEAGTVSLGPEPTEGTVSREGLDVADLSVFFRDYNVGVRLEYPGDEAQSALTLVWFSMGEDLATIDCDGPPLSCALRP